MAEYLPWQTPTLPAEGMDMFQEEGIKFMITMMAAGGGGMPHEIRERIDAMPKPQRFWAIQRLRNELLIAHGYGELVEWMNTAVKK